MMATQNHILALFFLILISCTGCASLIVNGPQAIPIKSNPEGSNTVIIDMRSGNKVSEGTTPFIARLERGAGYFKKAKYKVIFEKIGYSRKEMLLEGSASNWYIYGNLCWLSGAPIGWLIVDPITGAMWTLEPDDINMDLDRKSSFYEKQLVLSK